MPLKLPVKRFLYVLADHLKHEKVNEITFRMLSANSHQLCFISCRAL